MKYPIKILKEENRPEYKFFVVDLPGCQLTALSVDEGMDNLNMVIADHLTILTEYGETITPAKTIDEHRLADNDINAIWAIIDFDIIPYMGKSHKINVTLPELLIKKIDDRVMKSADYTSRSGFIASACLKQLIE